VERRKTEKKREIVKMKKKVW